MKELTYTIVSDNGQFWKELHELMQLSGKNIESVLAIAVHELHHNLVELPKEVKAYESLNH